jgi:hypothetical protein
MKWKEFKEYVESKGVNDDTEIAYENMNFGGNDGEIDKWCIEVDTENNELRFNSKYYADLD